ncbi:GCN5 family acetyltransferase [Bosea sp. Root381]|uniref:GNAT family N-acetyltransferase n=1 Tax=Bosea sp. Root381 TaxID=1736524 RepID=UPI0006F915AF|nr:GNAT family N-acetyltransferase [Bosea sp. Root381]KRE06719.1 GCN5 family acetyltransferase [Bosea sp. Root381]
MEVEIRPATIADAGAIAALHVKVWRETYRQIAPADVQLALDEKHRMTGWRARLSAPSPGEAVFVAEFDRRVVGIVAAGKPSNAIFGDRGEIGALYVDSALQRHGIGRRLLATAMRHLQSQGFGGVGLGVVAGNDPAIAFYTALGGQLAGQYRDAGPLWRSSNIAIVWDGTEPGT